MFLQLFLCCMGNFSQSFFYSPSSLPFHSSFPSLVPPNHSNISRVYLFLPILGHDVFHLAAFRDINDGGIEKLFDTVLTLLLETADLAVLQGLVKGVHHLWDDDDDIGADMPEAEVTAGDQDDEETEQKAKSVAGEYVPPVVSVVAHPGHRTRHGPHGYQALQPRFQKQRPIRQTVLQVPLCGACKSAFLKKEKKNRYSCVSLLIFYFYFARDIYSTRKKKFIIDRNIRFLSPTLERESLCVYFRKFTWRDSRLLSIYLSCVPRKSIFR